MLPTEARVGHLATIRARRLHACMSHGRVPGPCNCSCPPPCSASLPFVRSRTVASCLVPQVGVSRVSCKWGPTCSHPQCLHVSVELFNMNGSARPAYKHYLLYLPPFDLTDRLETRQQTLVLLLSNRCCPLHVVASCILRSLEFDG